MLAEAEAHVKAQLLRSNDGQLFDRPRCLSLNMCEKPAICSLTHFTVPPAKKKEPIVVNGAVFRVECAAGEGRWLWGDGSGAFPLAEARCGALILGNTEAHLSLALSPDEYIKERPLTSRKTRRCLFSAI